MIPKYIWLYIGTANSNQKKKVFFGLSLHAFNHTKNDTAHIDAGKWLVLA